jgi:hypothetical protein
MTGFDEYINRVRNNPTQRYEVFKFLHANGEYTGMTDKEAFKKFNVDMLDDGVAKVYCSMYVTACQPELPPLAIAGAVPPKNTPSPKKSTTLEDKLKEAAKLAGVGVGMIVLGAVTDTKVSDLMETLGGASVIGAFAYAGGSVAWYKYLKKNP